MGCHWGFNDDDQIPLLSMGVPYSRVLTETTGFFVRVSTPDNATSIPYCTIEYGISAARYLKVYCTYGLP